MENVSGRANGRFQPGPRLGVDEVRSLDSPAGQDRSLRETPGKTPGVLSAGRSFHMGYIGQ